MKAQAGSDFPPDLLNYSLPPFRAETMVEQISEVYQMLLKKVSRKNRSL